MIPPNSRAVPSVFDRGPRLRAGGVISGVAARPMRPGSLVEASADFLAG